MVRYTYYYIISLIIYFFARLKSYMLDYIDYLEVVRYRYWHYASFLNFGVGYSNKISDKGSDAVVFRNKFSKRFLSFEVPTQVRGYNWDRGFGVDGLEFRLIQEDYNLSTEYPVPFSVYYNFVYTYPFIVFRSWYTKETLGTNLGLENLSQIKYVRSCSFLSLVFSIFIFYIPFICFEFFVFGLFFCLFYIKRAACVLVSCVFPSFEFLKVVLISPVFLMYNFFYKTFIIILFPFIYVFRISFICCFILIYILLDLFICLYPLFQRFQGGLYRCLVYATYGVWYKFSCYVRVLVDVCIYIFNYVFLNITNRWFEFFSFNYSGAVKVCLAVVLSPYFAAIALPVFFASEFSFFKLFILCLRFFKSAFFLFVGFIYYYAPVTWISIISGSWDAFGYSLVLTFLTLIFSCVFVCILFPFFKAYIFFKLSLGVKPSPGWVMYRVDSGARRFRSLRAERMLELILDEFFFVRTRALDPGMIPIRASVAPVVSNNFVLPLSQFYADWCDFELAFSDSRSGTHLDTLLGRKGASLAPFFIVQDLTRWYSYTDFISESYNTLTYKGFQDQHPYLSLSPVDMDSEDSDNADSRVFDFPDVFADHLELSFGRSKALDISSLAIIKESLSRFYFVSKISGTHTTIFRLIYYYFTDLCFKSFEFALGGTKADYLYEYLFPDFVFSKFISAGYYSGVSEFFGSFRDGFFFNNPVIPLLDYKSSVFSNDYSSFDGSFNFGGNKGSMIASKAWYMTQNLEARSLGYIAYHGFYRVGQVESLKFDGINDFFTWFDLDDLKPKYFNVYNKLINNPRLEFGEYRRVFGLVQVLEDLRRFVFLNAELFFSYSFSVRGFSSVSSFFNFNYYPAWVFNNSFRSFGGLRLVYSDVFSSVINYSFPYLYSDEVKTSFPVWFFENSESLLSSGVTAESSIRSFGSIFGVSKGTSCLSFRQDSTSATEFPFVFFKGFRSRAKATFGYSSQLVSYFSVANCGEWFKDHCWPWVLMSRTPISFTFFEKESGLGYNWSRPLWSFKFFKRFRVRYVMKSRFRRIYSTLNFLVYKPFSSFFKFSKPDFLFLRRVKFFDMCVLVYCGFPLLTLKFVSNLVVLFLVISVFIRRRAFKDTRISLESASDQSEAYKAFTKRIAECEEDEMYLENEEDLPEELVDTVLELVDEDMLGAILDLVFDVPMYENFENLGEVLRLSGRTSDFHSEDTSSSLVEDVEENDFIIPLLLEEDNDELVL